MKNLLEFEKKLVKSKIINTGACFQNISDESFNFNDCFGKQNTQNCLSSFSKLIDKFLQNDVYY